MKVDFSALGGERPWSRLALALILLVFAATQVMVILLGPGLYLSHDEANFIIEGMRLPAQRKMVGYVHGPFVYELMAVMETAWYLVARLLGQVQSPVDHLANVLANPAAHIKAARLLVSAAGVLCLVEVYRVTRLLADRWPAVLATFLCAVSLTFGVWSSLAKEDVIYWLLLLLAIDLMGRTSPGERLRPALAGVAVGVAFATKYLGFFGMVLALVPLVRSNREGRRQAFRQGGFMAGGALAAVLVVYPFLITDHEGVLFSLRHMSTALAGMTQHAAFGPYLFGHLPTLTGPVVGVAALAELVVRLRREPRGPVLLFTPFLLILAFLLSRRGYNPAHYIFPVVIAAIVLAASFAARVTQSLRGHWKVVPLLALLAVALFDPAYLPSRLKFAVMVAGPDTRALAAQRVAELVPAGACVLISGGVVGWNNLGPALAPAEAPSSANPTGSFAAAERLAITRRPSPHYRLQIVDGNHLPEVVPAGCDWAVGHLVGAWSTQELGPPPPEQGRVPVGFRPVAEIPAYPVVHSYFFPFLMSLDYQEIRSTPLSRLWRERALGATYVIYRRSSAAP